MRWMAVWILIVSIWIGGCSWPGGKSQPPGPDPGTVEPGPGKHSIARADAEALVSAYLQDRVEGRQAAALQRLVPATGDRGPSTGELTQFQLLNATEVEEGWIVQTREYLSLAHEPRSSVITDFYLVLRENDRLAIDRPERRWTGAKAEPYRRVVLAAFPDPESPQRRLLMTKDTKTILAVMAPNLPKTFRPYGAPPDGLFGVGDNGWGALALSPLGQHLAFVTRGTHAFLGIVDASGQVQGLDLWFEGGAGELAWSHDGHYLAATNWSPRGLFVLQLWSFQRNAPVDVTGLPDGRDISRLQWQGGSLHLRAGAERWVVNTETGRAIPLAESQ